jgi:hypothetical protein
VSDKIPKSEFDIFTVKWEKKFFPSQRFGQAFVNTYMKECPHFDDATYCLFADNDHLRARRWIQANMIDYSESIT